MTPWARARLIWITKRDRRQNQYLVFKKSFRLAGRPAAARLRISAYAHYQVSINGVWLGRGPDPSHPRHYYVDPYDARPCLRRGRNVISVLAYAFGPELPGPESAYLQGESGWLAFELECSSPGGRVSRIGSDGRCRVRPADAWRRDTPGYTELRAAYKEYIDGAKYGYEGLRADPPEGPGWRPAVERGPADTAYRYEFFPKEIKPFRQADRLPAAAYCLDGGYAYGFSERRGWQIENPEALVPGYPLKGYQAILRGGEPNFVRPRMATDVRLGCTVRRRPGSGTPSLWLDFGALQVGDFILELDTPAAGSVLEIGYGESPNLTYIDRYRTCAGRQVFQPYHRRAGRYAVVTFSRIAAPLRVLGARFRTREYPPEGPGACRLPSETLNRIRAMSVRTLNLSMHSHFEDCPWREQKLYIGDMLVQARAAYYTWGEYGYTRKCLQQLGSAERADGWLSASGPGLSRGDGLIYDFPLYYALVLRDYLLFSGDAETARALYPKAVAQIRRFLGPAFQWNGLADIGPADTFGSWCFINWNTVAKKGRCAPLNFVLARALAAAAETAAWLGRARDAAELRGLRDGMRRSLDLAFWDARRSLYRDGRWKGRPIERYSTETNTLAILAGTTDRRRTVSILDALEAGRLDPATPTAFFNASVAEALFRHYRTQAALGLIERYWGAMLQRGADTAWEMFLPESPPAGHPPKFVSLCHGWSSGPAYLLPAYGLGIRPIEPGFRTFCLDPQMPIRPGLSGVVPTPHGPIAVSAGEGVLMVRHPAAVRPAPGPRRAALAELDIQFSVY